MCRTSKTIKSGPKPGSAPMRRRSSNSIPRRRTPKQNARRRILRETRFIAYSTWKWLELQLDTGKSPVFRYEFDETLPLPANAKRGTEPTAPHASEIEFVFRMLSSKKLPWRPEDRNVSELMASYWTNFAKTGDPNGPGLPPWPEYNSGDGYQVMHLSADSGAAPDNHRGRYEFLDQLNSVR
jgi:para-nitrobenzyl esterase